MVDDPVIRRCGRHGVCEPDCQLTKLQDRESQAGTLRPENIVQENTAPYLISSHVRRPSTHARLSFSYLLLLAMPSTST